MNTRRMEFVNMLLYSTVHSIALGTIERCTLTELLRLDVSIYSLP
jgi:hypothetical protein